MIDFKKGSIRTNYLNDFFNEDNYRFFAAKQIILDVQYGSYSIEVFSDYPSNPQVMIKEQRNDEKEVKVKQEVVDKEDMYNVLKQYIDLLDSFQENLWARR